MLECVDKLYAKREISTDAVHGYSFALAAMASIVSASPLGMISGARLALPLCGVWVMGGKLM